MFRPMMRRVRLDTIERRRILACSILLAVIAIGALPGVSQASHKLRGVGFSTIVPSKWKVTKGKTRDPRVYRASSPGARPNVTVNSAVLGVIVTTAKTLERRAGRKLPSSPEELLGLVAGAPGDVQGLQIVAPTRGALLDGVPAASIAVSYTRGGAAILQTDTVAVYHGRVYVVELATDISIQVNALHVLAQARSRWRWR
jgi:hypothetical protein